MHNYYQWFKAMHVISVISWMAGMLYLPRLYVYHSSVKYNSEMDKTFQTMEKKLMRFIMNPAMVFTYIFGLFNAYIYGFVALGMWFHIKMLAVLLLTCLHGFFAKCRKDFCNQNNKYSATFYRIINEVVTALMIISVIAVIVKPFD